MGTQGSFGYKIGKKVRLMHVQYDADLLWQICVREIFVLMKHFNLSIEALKTAFEGLKEAKNKPKLDAVARCRMFTDVTVSCQTKTDWYCLTRWCQHSYINVLESGYFLNNGQNSGYVFLIDFNTNSVSFYGVDHKDTKTQYDTATLEEIMEFEDMPTKSMTEILSEMKVKFEEHMEKLEKAIENIKKVQIVIDKAKELGNEQNIIGQAMKLKSDMELEKKFIEYDYKVFKDRLYSLNLIEEEPKEDK